MLLTESVSMTQPPWVTSLQLALTGDLDAFEDVMRRFEAMAFGFAYSVLGDFHLAQDAAQEAFIQAYLSLPTLCDLHAFPAWMRRIVLSKCNLLTRRKRHLTVPIDELGVSQRAESEPDLLELVMKEDERRAVKAAVLSLPEHERAVVTLFHLGGYSMAEVGEFLEIPAKTVKSRLHSARLRLKKGMVELVEDTLRQNVPGESLRKQVRKVLEGVERIHWETTSVLCFPGSFAASMRFLGESVTNDWAMGISGGAFKLLWRPQWSPANCDLLVLGEEPIRRAFGAMGYEYTWIYDPAGERRTAEAYTELIMKCVDAGKPVLAIGIVGPPECAVVTGYDKSGEVLYGRSYFQDNPNDYFRAENWLANCHGLLLIGEKRRTPGVLEVAQMSLEWAVRLARTPMMDGYLVGSPGEAIPHYTGLAAYKAIADALLVDIDFEEARRNPQRAELACYAFANDGILLLPWKRQSGAGYLRELVQRSASSVGSADVLPKGAVDSITKAADIYQEEADLLKPLSAVVSWSGAPEADKAHFFARESREIAAKAMLQAMELEGKAVACLEEALSFLSASSASS